MSECKSPDYLMNLDFESGIEIISEMKRQKGEERDEKFFSDIYYFAVQNGINDKYKTFGEFKSTAMAKPKPESAARKYKAMTKDEIMTDVKSILASFSGERGREDGT